jgi:signal transduction histidine kinase
MKEETLTPEEKRNYLAIALKHSDQLGKLVAELFELAKLDSPNVPVRFEPFTLAELIQDILQKFQLTAEKKKIQLRMDAAEGLPLTFADIGLCERVFENLIDNAIRYTPENGSIIVSVALGKDRIMARVSDTGAGIPPGDVPHLFDSIHRRERVRRDNGMGSGLGLAIVKRILELHGSGIDVSSTINVGTTFTFSLPVHTPK